MLISRKMLMLAKETLKTIFWVSFVQFTVFALSMVSALCVGKVIVLLSEGKTSALWLLGFVLSMLLLCCLRPLALVAQTKCSAQVKINLRERFVKKILDLGVLYKEENRTGDLTTTAVMRIEAIGQYFSVYIPTLLGAALITTLMILWLLSINWAIAMICAIGFLGVLIVPAFWYAKIYSKGNEVWREMGVFRSDFIDNIQGMSCLKNLEAQDLRRESLRELGQLIRKKTMDNLSVNSVESLFIYLFAGLGSGVSIAYGANLAVQGRLGNQSPVMLVFLITAAFAPIYSLVNAWHIGFIGLSAMTSLGKTLEQTPPAYQVTETSEARALDAVHMVCQHLDFSYSQMEDNTLEDISFVLEKGKTVAFVGRSGEGKTTLISILAGLYPYQHGKISYGDTILNDETRKKWFSQTGAIWQNQYLFSGTIRENLQMAKPTASEHELFEALDKAHLLNFVRSLPYGLESEVGEHGSLLSGGERQRLALARLFLKDPEILIFDEATSNLDEENQRLVTESIQELGENKLSIIVAHRVSTFKHADVIYYLEKGRIADFGTHEELLKRCEGYADIAGNEN